MSHPGNWQLAFITAGLVCLACAVAASAAEPTWKSLRHDPPEWLLDAKLGIYTHWGPYSVPAFFGEWYPKRMHQPGSAAYRHHLEKYGGAKKFPYHKFVDMFTAARYDPAEWARLMKATGAKYAGMAVVHHDGFLLWDSKVNRWNAKNMGPKRDCYGQYVEALRAEGLKTIATFHHIRTFNWYLPGTGGFGEDLSPKTTELVKTEGLALADPKYKDLYWNELAGGQYEDFLAEWQAKVREVIDKYQPDVVWFDGGAFRSGKSEKLVQNLLQYYHDRGRQWDKPVEVLNKLPVTSQFNFPADYGMLTFEEGRDRLGRVDRPWIDDMKISDKGWCYVEGQVYKTADEVIDGLIDRVARGGGLLLNFSPRADGTVPAEQKKTMLGIGAWLKVNGEAIYNTRPWKVVGEGDEAKLHRGKQWKFTDCDASDIRFTRSKDGRYLYAIALGYPANGKLRIATLSEQTVVADGPIKSITLIDGEKPVEWTRTGIVLRLTLPKGTPRHQPAYALRIEVEGKLDLGE